MKKKKIVLVIIVVLVTVWTIYRAIVPSYSSVLEANWDIELPVKALCKEVYSEDTGPSFHGDGILGLFAFDKTKIVVFGLEVDERKDELVLDLLPENTGSTGLTFGLSKRVGEKSLWT